MTRYTATIAHNSIARARQINAGDTLTAAKRAATAEFGDEMHGVKIIILDRDAANFDQEIVAEKTISAGKSVWRNKDR